METNELILNLVQGDNGITSIDVTLPILTKKDGEYYFVQCPAFKTLGASKVSFEDALKDHEIDLTIFFKVHTSRNTLQSALANLGWRKQKLSLSWEHGSLIAGLGIKVEL